MSSGIILATSVVVFKQELEQERLSIGGVMRICADLGIRALEIRDEANLGLGGMDVQGEQLREVCKELESLSSDLGVNLIVASGAALGSEGDYARLLKAIECATSLSSPIVRVFPPASAESSSHRDFGCPEIKRLEPILRTAESSGVLLCVENTSAPEGSIHRIADLVDSVESQLGVSLGITFDTGNCVMNDMDGSALDAMRTAGSRVRYVHLKDVRRDEDLSLTDCGPGTGIVDFGAVFSELARNSFRGYACFEFGGAGEGFMALEKALDHITRY